MMRHALVSGRFINVSITEMIPYYPANLLHQGIASFAAWLQP
jgi:hypothetical protein